MLVKIGNLGRADYRLREPILAEMTCDGGVSLWSEDFQTWGSGPHLTAAIRDLQVSVVDVVEWLAEGAAENKLSPRLQREFAHMRDIIEMRGADR